MKRFVLLLTLAIFFAACSSSKKTTPATKATTHKPTQKDIIKGGTSFDNAVVIKVQKESAGVEEEYRWLTESYPGYSMIRKTKATNGNRHFDIVKIKTREGGEKDIYFDTTSFFGKW